MEKMKKKEKPRKENIKKIEKMGEEKNGRAEEMDRRVE